MIWWKEARLMFDALAPSLKLPYRGRLLGFDVGDKYIGVAISDKSYHVASPLRVLNRVPQNGIRKDVAEEICQLVGRYSIAGFVFGWAELHGEPTSAMVHVESLIDELSRKQNLSQLHYTKWDESYSTKNVELLIKGLDFPPPVDKVIRDRFAALGILQDYLDAMNVDQETGLPIIRDGKSECSFKDYLVGVNVDEESGRDGEADCSSKESRE